MQTLKSETLYFLNNNFKSGLGQDDVAFAKTLHPQTTENFAPANDMKLSKCFFITLFSATPISLLTQSHLTAKLPLNLAHSDTLAPLEGQSKEWMPIQFRSFNSYQKHVERTTVLFAEKHSKARKPHANMNHTTTAAVLVSNMAVDGVEESKEKRDKAESALLESRLTEDPEKYRYSNQDIKNTAAQVANSKVMSAVSSQIQDQQAVSHTQLVLY